MRKTVYWIEGDGIGPDVWKSARPVIDEAIRLSYGDERGFDWKELLAGEKALKETGTLLPDETLAALRGAELAIKGPLGTPVGTGFRSLNVTLRQTMTEKGSKRLVRAAIRHALAQNLPSVTLVHKGNIMKFTEGAFRQHGYDVAKEEFAAQTVVEAEAASAPGKLVIKDRIADAMFQEALIRPEQYSVLATPNLNGDYISDALAAQVGGLGLAPGVNMSEKLAFFEATHGTAPSLAGKDRANPGSLILSGALMLEHIGWKEAATRIYKAVNTAIARRAVTEDLAAQMTDARTVGCTEFGEIITKLL